MATPYPRTLPDVLRATANARPAAQALLDGEVSLSYAELHREVQTTARALVALGIGPGDRVGIWAPNSWQWVGSALAVTYIGAVLVPLNSRYTGHEVVDIARRTRARALFVADGFLGRGQLGELRKAAAGEGGGGFPIPGLPDLVAVVRIPYPGSGDVDDALTFPELAALADGVPLETVEALADAVSPDDVADILFTSGTTGRSKGARSAHRQTVTTAREWAEHGRVGPADRYLIVNPFFHSFGYKAGILVCLLHGAAMLPQPVFDLRRTLRLIRDERVTLLAGAPTIFQALLDAPGRAERDTGSLRLAVTGATIVPVALVERMQAELGFDLVLTAYGLTEAVVATMCRPGDPAALVAGSVGRAVESYELRIGRPGGNEPQPAGVEGEVLLRGENVMLGYLDDPEATAETIDGDGWLHTGDIGRLDDRGYLTITDRLKDMFITGGFNVYPAEIEQVLARLDGVVESAAIGVPDERLGEVGMVYVVRRAGSDLTEDDVRAHCEERLANFKVPRQVAFIDELPRNLSGKVLKRGLRQATPRKEQV
ncbi:FadD3 family acyl-CoA ligase [Actinoallomurus bryophytorum]|uniref:Acyl-CoA synthetase (AMP-forming)/AMP-acid ligase II n=1 Tax=Actinoallomurus bryophytorum TaxID=1490222 RepID=A0A543BZ29_9ACTN|nr:FadD3 family acyl-CoA ligase [Actinoallomurus bryophytorum]TQL90090.1 acyl-CoA synthetase (AMP-forming)/AMP-acid ligase II [Actinoallomurus bryophytorum]